MCVLGVSTSTPTYYPIPSEAPQCFAPFKCYLKTRLGRGEGGARWGGEGWVKCQFKQSKENRLLPIPNLWTAVSQSVSHREQQEAEKQQLNRWEA